MSTPVKLVGFLAAIAAIFGITLAVGRAVGPVDDAVASERHDDSGVHSESADQTQEPTSTGATDIPGGLMVSQNGYTLALDPQPLAAGTAVPVTFTVTGPDGAPVTAYDVEHEKRLHFIAVRGDFTGFQHVHPEFDETTGAWSTNLDLTAGTWRVFADFKAAGAAALTLTDDLFVAGAFDPAPLATENRTATVGDYEVTLHGDLEPGKDAKLTLSIARNGTAVTDLDPYLGAYGHLVALRGGDLAYLHVHPDGTPGDGSTQPGPDVVFYAAVPSTGTYHLYLDFQHGGEVHTAAFTVTAVGPDSVGNSAAGSSAAHSDAHTGD